jgi:bifunctional NMN adenylyltransferase/nudix hydrolase
MKSDALGVVVVRLQVPELHAGHRYLLNTVTAIHKNVLVVIGETEARLTVEDPLTFNQRAAMLRVLYPNVIIDCLRDQPIDAVWSDHLDSTIAMHLGEVDPHGDPVLYGGRDSFLKHYTGMHRTFELPPISDSVSGTEVRAAVEERNTADFRAGVVFASQHKYPTSYQCVDVCVMKHGDVLLGQKKSDNGKWRFIGGFVSTSDASLEAAAKREVREEIRVEPGDAIYLGSSQIDDFRYPKEGTDRLMSAFFVMDYTFGCPRAADDLDNCRWFEFGEVRANLIPSHLPLMDLLERWEYNAR